MKIPPAHPNSTARKTSALSTSRLSHLPKLYQCRQDTWKLLESKDLAAEDLEGIQRITPALNLLRCLWGCSSLKVKLFSKKKIQLHMPMDLFDPTAVSRLGTQSNNRERTANALGTEVIRLF